MVITSLQPISTVDLFWPLQQELVALLRGLSPEDWSKPTVAGSWRVKDIVTHLLDSDVRRLSLHRDGHVPPPTASPQDYGELVAYLNDLNASWVSATQRLSPNVLVALLEWTGPQLADFFAALPPDGPAFFPVAWAGEEQSTNWMDIGREYTEKWHHQAQIRDAVGAPGLASRRWLHPLLALSMYALPYTFRQTDAPAGSTLSVNIDSEAGGHWFIIREEGDWKLNAGEIQNPTASVRLDADTAWRLFFNGLAREEAEKRIEATGDPELCATFLTMRAVMV